MKKILLIVFLLASCVNIDTNTTKCLQEAIIVIDPGHGGKDNGASNGVLIEDVLNLEISFLISNYLMNKGAMVYFTRDGDYDLSSEGVSNKKKDDLKERLNLIHSINPDLFISIHMNTYSSSNVNGAQVFYYKDDKLANCIQTELNKTNIKSKNVKKGDIFLLRNSLVDCCLIECGFVTGSIDYQNFQTEKYKKIIAEYIAFGIENYLINN